jgi:L-2-amino-thiazoline-4-carboxylic acid hydrolase
MVEINKIPADIRWQIATQGLTGAYIALAEMFRKEKGKEFYVEFAKQLWGSAGPRAKEFTNAFGLPTGTLKELNDSMLLFALSSMGPEFKFEMVEASDTRCVWQTTTCPWANRAKEQGVAELTCKEGHQAWAESVIKELNPEMKFTLTQSIPDGNSKCEWIIEKIN